MERLRHVHDLRRALAAPASSAPPAISGTPEVGRTLTASTGTWSGTPSSYAYRWRRCSGRHVRGHPVCDAELLPRRERRRRLDTAGRRHGDERERLRLGGLGTDRAGGRGTSAAAAAPAASATPATASATSLHATGGRAPSAPPRPEPGPAHPATATSSARCTASTRRRRRRTSAGTAAAGARASRSSRSSTARTPRAAPTSLVTRGQAVTVAAGRPAGWITAPLPSGVTLAPGRYLLGLLSGPQGGSAFVYYDDGPADAAWWNANGSGTPTQTWGALNSSGQRWSFYVELQTSTPPAPPGPPANESPPSDQRHDRRRPDAHRLDGNVDEQPHELRVPVAPLPGRRVQPGRWSHELDVSPHVRGRGTLARRSP